MILHFSFRFVLFFFVRTHNIPKKENEPTKPNPFLHMDLVSSFFLERRKKYVVHKK